MKLIAYTVDLRFANAPTVSVQIAVTDPATGTDSIQTLTFNDEAGREIHVMKQNPEGEGLVATGDIDRGKLDAAIAARFAEALDAPADVGARIAAADTARREQAAAIAAKAALVAEAAALDAQIAAKRAELAALEVPKEVVP